MVGMAECYSMGRSKTSRSDAGNRRKLAMANLCQDTSSKYRYLNRGSPPLQEYGLVSCHSVTKAGQSERSRYQRKRDKSAHTV